MVEKKPDNASAPDQSGSSDDGSAGQSETIPAQGRIAGIDFGTVRIGLALTDPDQTIASPFEIYHRRSLKLDKSYFQKFVAEERIVGFVVGLPVHMSGDESGKSREAREFGGWLKKFTEVPVVWFDERYSTAAARELLQGSNLSGKKRKAMLDKLAAQVILSTWLESRSKSGTGENDLRALDD